MKAVVLPETGDPASFRLQEVEEPKPGAGEVLIRPFYCGVDGHDLVVRQGVMRRGFRPGLIQGHEVSGEVVEVGGHVTDLKPGDRVATKAMWACGRCRYCRTGEETLCVKSRFVEGGLAELAVFPEECVLPIPEGVGMIEAAIAACAIATPYHAVRDVAETKPGEVVLVTGAGGGLGIHCVQIAKLFGATVIAWTTSEKKIDGIKASGADQVVLSRAGAGPIYKQVRQLTDGRGADVVIDTVGSAAFTEGFRALGKLGRYVFVGQLTGDEIRINPARIFFKGAKLLGSISHRRHEVEETMQLIADGKIKPVVSGVYSLDQVPHVHELLENRQLLGRPVIAVQAEA